MEGVTDGVIDGVCVDVIDGGEWKGMALNDDCVRILSLQSHEISCVRTALCCVRFSVFVGRCGEGKQKIAATNTTNANFPPSFSIVIIAALLRRRPLFSSSSSAVLVAVGQIPFSTFFSKCLPPSVRRVQGQHGTVRVSRSTDERQKTTTKHQRRDSLLSPLSSFPRNVPESPFSSTPTPRS